MRLIDADALIDDVMERYCKKCDKRKGIKSGKWRIIYEIGEAPCRACDVDDLKVELEEAPTIEPVKHGKWFNTTTDIPNLLMNVCSECGFQYPSAIRPRFNYCPNCGARMDL